MAVIVQKYGGSSVADVEKIAQVAEKVAATKQAGHDVVVVVSAMGKTTDGLLALAKNVAETAGSEGREPARRELDMLVSTGERVTMALLSIALGARGFDAISFTGSQSGILTNDRHFDARILEVRPHRIEDELARGKIVIVAGYQGMSYRREITTLGRGGSDTTAVALAAALGAERCEIYSDVDGVYSADPRVVGDARHLPEVGLDVLQELAEAGAKVLNAQAVEWARRNKVRIFARKTADSSGARETISTDGALEASHAVSRVRAVVGCKAVLFVGAPIGALHALLRVLAREGVAFVHLATSPAAVTVAIPLANCPDWARTERALRTEISELSCHAGDALLSVVGDGISSGGTALEVLRTLELTKIEAQLLDASALRVTVRVAERDLDEATRALHGALV